MTPDTVASDATPRDPRAGARRTLWILMITVSTMVTGSVIFMVMEGRNRIPEDRPLLVILPFEGLESGSDRYAGFGEGLATYFSRVDPRDLGVLGPASTTDQIAAMDGDARALGRKLEADMILMGREMTRDSTLVLVAQLMSVVTGERLWLGEYEVGEPGALRLAQTRIGTEVTQVLDLPR